MHKFAISAPEKPGVRVANLLAYSSFDYIGFSFNGCRWTINIYFLPSKSGKFISIILSNLPGLVIAGSRSSFLFVAANTIT